MAIKGRLKLFQNSSPSCLFTVRHTQHNVLAWVEGILRNLVIPIQLSNCWIHNTLDFSFHKANKEAETLAKNGRIK